MRDLDLRLTALKIARVAGAFRPLSADQLAELETAIGAPLPSDYREFVTRYGRCRFDDGLLVNGPKGSKFPLDVFFGAPEPGRSDDVFWYAETFGHQLDNGLLTIARDLLGDLYVLDARSGNVWFRNFHSGDGSLSEVASSFSDLLDRAEIEIDDED